MSEDKRVLLPKTVKPSKYNLTLKPDFEKFVFDGLVDVSIAVLEQTNKIVFHAVEITINKSSLTGAGATQVPTDVSEDKDTQMVTLTFANPIAKGDYTLSIDYQGILNDQMAGFYRSKYTDQSGKEKWMGTTQFEPTDARRALPCWDEPAAKAKFTVNIKAPKGYDALSNMPESKVETHEDGSKTYSFQETPIMSSYLLAFVVGEFECVSGKSDHGVLFRVWTPKGRKEEGKFALDVGMKILDYYEDWFDVKYPLPKQDMIAIADFAAGAMENWGLITYRETALLCDTQSATVSSKQRVAYVVAHELAHQWFGNLVTMDWWTDLWLNEGFATFVGNQAVDFLFPEWKVWTSFVSDYVFRAFKLDSMRSSHPIEVEINRSQEVDSIFDAISYCKGASVIRMLADLLGETAFRNGLRAYLKKFQYSNTVTMDLWNALGESSGKPVAKIMANWTQAKGFPVVNVESKGNGKFHLSQHRFLSAGEPNEEEDKTLWCCNIAVKTDKVEKMIELYGREADIDLGECSWVKFNVGQAGFFRVQYDEATTKLVSAALEGMKLEPTDRLGVQNDVFALARSNRTTIAAALEISQAYKNEVNYAVWSDLSANLGSIAALFSEDENYPKFKKFTLALYQNIGKKLGWEENAGESDLDKLLRSIVLKKLGGNGDEAILAEAQKRFSTYMADPKALRSDLRSVVLMLIGRNATPEQYDQMLERFKAAATAEEKLQNLRAACLAKDEKLIKRAIDLTFSGVVRNQDLMYIYVSVVASPKGREMAWDYFSGNWAKFTSSLGGSFLIERLTSYICSGFLGEKRATEIETFFKDKDTTRIARALAQSLEAVRTNTKFVTTNAPSFAKFTAKY